MKKIEIIIGVGIALLILVALGANVIAASAIKGNDTVMYIACVILAGVFLAMKWTPVAIFFIAIPALAVAGWALSFIWAVITGFFAGLGMFKVIILVAGIVFFATLLLRRRHR